MTTKAIKALTYVWTIQKLETVTQDFGGLIFTTAVQEGKKKSFNVSHGSDTARGVRFYFVLRCTFFLAHCEQVYLFLALVPFLCACFIFFWLAPFISLPV